MERMDQASSSKRKREATDLEQISSKRPQKALAIDVASIAGTKLKVMNRSASFDDLASLQPHDLDSSSSEQERKWLRVSNIINGHKEYLKISRETKEEIYNDIQNNTKEYEKICDEEYQWRKKIELLMKKSDLLDNYLVLPYDLSLVYFFREYEELQNLDTKDPFRETNVFIIKHKFYIIRARMTLEQLDQNIEEAEKEVNKLHQNCESYKYKNRYHQLDAEISKINYAQIKNELDDLIESSKQSRQKQDKALKKKFKSKTNAMKFFRKNYERMHPDGICQKAERELKELKSRKNQFIMKIQKLEKQAEDLNDLLICYKETLHSKQEKFKNLVPDVERKDLALLLKQAKLEEKHLAKYAEFLQVAMRKQEIKKEIEFYDFFIKGEERSLDKYNNFSVILHYKLQLHKLDQEDYQIVKQNIKVFDEDNINFLNDSFNKLSMYKQSADNSSAGIMINQADINKYIKTRDTMYKIFQRVLENKVDAECSPYENKNPSEITDELIDTKISGNNTLCAKYDSTNSEIRKSIQKLDRKLFHLLSDKKEKELTEISTKKGCISDIKCTSPKPSFEESSTNFIKFLTERDTWLQHSDLFTTCMKALDQSKSLDENIANLHNIIKDKFGSFNTKTGSIDCLIESYYKRVLTKNEPMSKINAEITEVLKQRFRKIQSNESKAVSNIPICTEIQNLITLYDRFIYLNYEIPTLKSGIHEYYIRKFENTKEEFSTELKRRIAQREQGLSVSKLSQLQASKSLKDEIERVEKQKKETQKRIEQSTDKVKALNAELTACNQELQAKTKILLIETMLQDIQDEYRVPIHDITTAPQLPQKQETSQTLIPAIEQMTQQFAEVQLGPTPTVVKKFMASLYYKIDKTIAATMYFEMHKSGKDITKQKQELLKFSVAKVSNEIKQQLESQHTANRGFFAQPVGNKVERAYLTNLKALIKQKIESELKEWRDACSQLPQMMEIEKNSASSSQQTFASDDNSDDDEIEIILDPKRVNDLLIAKYTSKRDNSSVS